MNTPVQNDRFIPLSRQQLLQFCLAEGQFSADEAARFRAFVELYAAHTHFRFHQLEERLKDNYAPFNPERTAHHLEECPEQLAVMEEALLTTLTHTLERANYHLLGQAAVQRAIASSDLIDIKTEVNFDELAQLICYYRGESNELGKVTKLHLWKRTVAMRVFGHVLLGIKFKEAAYFISKGHDLSKLHFQPGRMYFYLYKQIPSRDLELLFPNVRLGMNRFDQLLFVLPAMGAGVSILLKAIPNLLLLLGVILFFTLGPTFAQRVGVNEGQIHGAAPILLAFLSVSMALGGFAYKQYDSYKNKHIQFLKTVTETLFFKNLATNANVFYSVVHAGEEEECKETVLLYYHLLQNNGCLNAAQLKATIESWLASHLQTSFDFPIAKTLQTLGQLQYSILPPGVAQARTVALVTVDAAGLCWAAPLIEAKMVLDRLWDTAFDY